MDPDADELLRRARAEVDAGRAWRAREKLRTWLRQFDFDVRFAELLGELALEAGDLPVAGRWLWGAGSIRPEHREAIQLHLRRHPGRALPETLPSSLRTKWKQIPERAKRDLEDAGVTEETLFERTKRSEVGAGLAGVLGILVFAVGVLTTFVFIGRFVRGSVQRTV